ncbi:unnamed protein product [Diamesa serratosioi]
MLFNRVLYQPLKGQNHKADKTGWKRTIRVVQVNIKTCILILLMFLIGYLLLKQVNVVLDRQPKQMSLSDYLRYNFKDIHQIPKNEEPAVDDAEEYQFQWDHETQELFKQQLEISDNEDEEGIIPLYSCDLGTEFIVSALPGPEYELSDFVWQFLSLDSLEKQHNEFSQTRKLSLKSFLTSSLKLQMDQLFEEVSMQRINVVPENCYNLKYAKIIGNVEEIMLAKTSETTIFLLEQKTKRWQEIVELQANNRLKLRFKSEIMVEVEQELLVTKTVQEVEKVKDVNFIGLYITSEEKIPVDYYLHAMAYHRKNSHNNVFIVICDIESLDFCQQNLEKGNGELISDVRVLRQSTELFDFALMASMNQTIVSNEYGLLHAILNGGTTTVYQKEIRSDNPYNVAILMSEIIENWFPIE